VSKVDFLGGKMSNKATILILFAWVMELVGVSTGVPNALYTTFGGELPNTIPGYIPAVPMIALAVAELGRVPLASVIYEKHKFMQLVAVLGILALGYVAVENWTFGFERIVDLRLKTVNAASRELSRVESDLSALVDQRNQLASSGGEKRQELRRGIGQRDASIAELTSQLNKEADTHQKILEEIREQCRIVREKCMVPRSQAEDSRYAGEINRLTHALTQQREDRKGLQTQIDALVSSDALAVAELDRKIGTVRGVVAEARKAVRSAQDANQIYRLAASWFRVSVSNVTEEQFATARWVFATFSAVAVSLAGSIAALVYYARSRIPGAPSFFVELMTKVARARRAYYARRRKPIVREVLGPERVVYRDGKEPPTVIEKLVEVVRYIDQIVLIPRFGIKAPIHINSLLRRNDRRFLDEPVDTSNVASFNKKVS
jgi:hypothetical protein